METELIQKTILDACCGGRTFWFDKQNKHTIYIDKRVMEKQIIWQSKDGLQKREFEVKPDIVADFTDLPFSDEVFYHVVFDPPHLVSAGETSWLAKKYGSLRGNWRDMIRKGFKECMRVLKPYGTLVFKWNETDVKLSEILDLCSQKPLYGHRSNKGGKTHWLVFMKFPEHDPNF
ncbi:MAG: methyltransferase [Bacteroidales bacterium]|nr:methyltransferase [Bacteroidales bacterium]